MTHSKREVDNPGARIQKSLSELKQRFHPGQGVPMEALPPEVVGDPSRVISLGEDLMELTMAIQTRIKDLAAGLAVFSEDLGVPIPKAALSLTDPMKDGPRPVNKGLITGAVDRLREINTVLEASIAIFDGMKADLVPVNKMKAI